MYSAQYSRRPDETTSPVGTSNWRRRIQTKEDFRPCLFRAARSSVFRTYDDRELSFRDIGALDGFGAPTGEEDNWMIPPTDWEGSSHALETPIPATESRAISARS